MSITSISLLECLRQSPSESAWQRLVELYTPLIQIWLRRYSLRNQDIEDLSQEVLAVVVRRVADFKRNAQAGSFRRWLRTITVNCLRDFWRAQRYRPRDVGFDRVLDELADTDSPLSKLWDKEHDEYVTRRLLARIQPCFQPKTWQAFQRVALEGVAVDQVAAELGLSINAVFIAKSRVVHMLRRESQGLIDC
jgi:RNA polymerase sigma-70 factor (ECF subfamily)